MEYSVGKISYIQMIQGDDDMSVNIKKKILKEIERILSKTTLINTAKKHSLFL